MKNFSAAVAFAMTVAPVVHAQESDDPFHKPQNSEIHVSPGCLAGALRTVFGEKTEVDENIEDGLITANNAINQEHVLAEIYSGFKGAIAGVHVTVIDGVEFAQTAPQGTATIYYVGKKGFPEFALHGYSQESLEGYIGQLDAEIRECDRQLQRQQQPHHNIR